MSSTSKRSAAAAARQRLVEAHRDEYRKLLIDEYRDRGLELEPTPEEKAEARLAKLLEEYPHLQQRFHQPTPTDPATPSAS